MFFQKRIWVTLLSAGVQSANVKKRKTVFRIIVLVIETYFHEKRFLIGLVNIIKGVAQESIKKTFQKKNYSRKSFPWNIFLKETIISTGTEERRQKKNIFRASITFLIENHFQIDQIFGSFGVYFQQGTEDWQKYFKFKFQEK